jgi:hypothetical protein
MPMKKDPELGGTEKDGSKSGKYCSYCYKDGEFTWKDCTPEQMREFCIEQMAKGGMPKFVAKFLTMGIPKLERWRNK